MVKSMTGYGVVQGKIGPRRVSVEVKSVNHKYCEANPRVPPRLSPLEGKIFEYTKAFFVRGRIDIHMREEAWEGGALPARIDLSSVKAYHRELKKVAKILGIPPEIKMDTLLTLPHVLLSQEDDNIESLWRQMKKLLKEAFEAVEKMRAKEGKAIGDFLLSQIAFLNRQIKSIEALVPENVTHHQNQLELRIQKLTSTVELDPQRLSQEIAYFVDRTDISEELQRLKVHQKHFKEILKAKGPVGRKLDFLLQELNREINTLSSKAQNATISKYVVEGKHALEKMREQVQNVE